MPSGNVNGGQILGQVDDLNGVKGTEGVVEGLLFLGFNEHSPKLLGEEVGGSLELKISSKLGNIFSGVWSLDSLESGGGPPLSDFISNLSVSNILVHGWRYLRRGKFSLKS